MLKAAQHSSIGKAVRKTPVAGVVRKSGAWKRIRDGKQVPESAEVGNPLEAYFEAN